MARLNSIQSDNKTTILIILALLGTVNIVVHVIPTAVYVGLLLAIQLVFVDKKDNAVIFIALGSVVGAVFATQGIRYIGAFLMGLGFLWVIGDYWKSINKLRESLLVLLVVVSLLYVSVVTTSGGFEAENKLRGTIINACLYLLSFGHIMLFRNKHNGTHLGFLYLCYAIVMMMYMNELGGSGGLMSSLFRLGGFRNEWGDYLAGKDKSDVFSFNYQTIGLDCCIGFALFYLSTPEGRNKLHRNVMWFLTIILLLYSGSRQSIYAFAAIIFLYFYVKNNAVSKWGGLLLIVLFVFMIFSQLDTGTSGFILGNDELGKGSTRSQLRAEAIETFTMNPIMGVGYGRFQFMGELGVDEHNIIIEILAELGLVGMTVISLLFGGILVSNWRIIKTDKQDLFPFIAIFTAILVRCMVSTSMREGILIFVLLSLIPRYAREQKYKKILSNT